MPPQMAPRHACRASADSVLPLAEPASVLGPLVSPRSDGRASLPSNARMAAVFGQIGRRQAWHRQVAGLP